ncbi:MAG: carbohydrate binding family 9 domain-containing protein [Acidobacteriota bacterium]
MAFVVLVLARLAAAAPATAVEPPSLRAVPLADEIVVDGTLDEVTWSEAPRGFGFVQREPNVGAPASEDTSVQVAFSETILYVAIRCFDSRPEQIVAQEMRRDSVLSGDDSIILLLDTFHDHRNAYSFQVNANGAQRDLLITDEGRDVNLSWDGVWWVGTRRDASGWSVEIAIPFATILFDAKAETWGLNVRRLQRTKNEETYWAPIPLDAGIARISLAGHLAGLEPPAPGLDLHLKPFAVGESESSAGSSSQDDGDWGLDGRWGLGRNASVNLTYNTDFAETEVDELRVNLTRFSLFFPEKREFFLENAGIFDFGFGSSLIGPPLLKVFHSRRIGIGRGGVEIPIEWGARFTGRRGEWSVGALHVETEGLDDPALGVVARDRSGVLRLTRNFGSRSRVGAMVTERDPAGRGANRTYGIDVNFNPVRRLNLYGFLSRSETSGAGDAGDAWGVGGTWSDSHWLGSLSVVEVDDEFDPELGFLLRRGVRQYLPNLQLLPRPGWRGVRNLDFQVVGEVVTDLDGDLLSVTSSATLFGVKWQTGDYWSLFVDWNFEELERPFEIIPGLVIPAADYTFPAIGTFFQTSPGRKVAIDGYLRTGEFYDGDRYDHQLRLVTRPSRFLGTETVWTYSDVRLPDGRFDVSVIRQRISVALRPTFTIDTFIQWNDLAELASLNARLRWQYRPGADLFLVYNHNWIAPSLGDLETRDDQILAKLTYLLDF